MKNIVFLLMIVFLPALIRAETITVSAAISMKESLTEIEKAYESESHDKVELNFGASGALAQQIEQGAPVDGFISAANKQVDELVKAKKVDADTRHVVVMNSIVLVVPADSKSDLKGFSDLASAKVKRISIGQPKAVPAGQYAEQTLKYLKLMDQVKDRLVYGANVRQVLDYVQRGEVDAGIIYATDAKQAGNGITMIATADAGTHEPIEYPSVVVSGTSHPDAVKKFFAYLGTDKARVVFAEKGFEIPHHPTTRPAR